MTACIHKIDPDWSCIECCEVIAQREENRRKAEAAQAAFNQTLAQNLPDFVKPLGDRRFKPIQAPQERSFHSAGHAVDLAAPQSTRAKYAGGCLCGYSIDVGDMIYRNKADTKWVCSTCHDEETP